MAKILLIENDITQHGKTSSTLDAFGFSVIQAECIVEGLEKISQYSVSLILCAEKLPGLDAYSLLKIRSSIGTLIDTPVIVYGASTKNMSELYKAGCDDFLLTPLDYSELQLRVRAVIRRFIKKGVRGDFGHIGILELIQLIISANRSGTMEIDSGSTVGVLGFREGQVFYSKSKSAEGEEAFKVLLEASSKGGSFTFESGIMPEFDDNITKRTDHLLLSLANIIDEGN